MIYSVLALAAFAAAIWNLVEAIQSQHQLQRVTAFATVLLMVGGVSAVIVRSGSSGPPHPKEWDPRVLDIVDFDEAHRGLEFKEPVFVDFLDPQAYSDRARTEESALSDEEKRQYEAIDGEFRALGLSNTKLDLLDEFNKLQDTGTLAFYDPDTERVVVRGTEITVDLEVTLVHEFVHVLQDQHFGVGRERTSRFKTSQESSAFRTIVEGDAVRIENEYIESLSPDEKAQYEQAHQADVDTATADLSSVPVALQALQLAPYVLGPELVDLLAALDDKSGVDNALDRPPTTDEQLVEPAKYLEPEGAADVEEPALPDGVSDDDVVDSGDFGALSWLFVLGERIDPIQALDAVDGWGGDAYVAYSQNGTTCIRLAWRGDTGDDFAQMQEALNQWVAAMPAGAASVSAEDDVLQLQSCDPGADKATLNNRALDVLQLPATRTALALSAVEQGSVDVDKAFAFGECVVRGLGFDQLVSINAAGLTDESTATLQSIAADCRAEVGG